MPRSPRSLLRGAGSLAARRIAGRPTEAIGGALTDRIAGVVVGLTTVPQHLVAFAPLPGMRPRAPRRNVLVGLIYLLLVGFLVLLVWSSSNVSQFIP